MRGTLKAFGSTTLYAIIEAGRPLHLAAGSTSAIQHVVTVSLMHVIGHHTTTRQSQRGVIAI